MTWLCMHDSYVSCQFLKVLPVFTLPAHDHVCVWVVRQLQIQNRLSVSGQKGSTSMLTAIETDSKEARPPSAAAA